MAAVAVAYIVGQTVVDTWGNWGSNVGKEKRGISHLRLSPRFVFVLLYKAEMQLIGVFRVWLETRK